MEIPVLLAHSIIRYYWSERIAILALTALFLLLLEVEYIRLEIRPKLPKILNFSVIDFVRPHVKRWIDNLSFDTRARFYLP